MASYSPPELEKLIQKLKGMKAKLDHTQKLLAEEREQRLQSEANLRLFYSEIKPLTDGLSIEQAIINRQNRRLRRAELIGKLKSVWVFRRRKRKRLFDELKALDKSYTQGKKAP